MISLTILLSVGCGASASLVVMAVALVRRRSQGPIPQEIADKKPLTTEERILCSTACHRAARFFFLLAIALLGYCVLLLLLIRNSAAAEGVLIAKKDWHIHHGPWNEYTFLVGWLNHAYLTPFIAAFVCLVSLALRPRIITFLLLLFSVIGAFWLLSSTFWLID